MDDGPDDTAHAVTAGRFRGLVADRQADDGLGASGESPRWLGSVVDDDGDASDELGPLRALTFREKVRTVVWVHKRRWLRRLNKPPALSEQCPYRPLSPSTRSFAREYERTLSRIIHKAIIKTIHMKNKVADLLGAPLHLMPRTTERRRVASQGRLSGAPSGEQDIGPRMSSGSVEVVSALSGGAMAAQEGSSQPAVEVAAAPIGFGNAYLIEMFRIQPFAAAAYLRALLYCWSSGVFLQLQAAYTFRRELDGASMGQYEGLAWQWLLCQLVLHLLQAPARLKLYLMLVGVSQSRDAEEANTGIQAVVTSRLWLASQVLGTVFHIVAAMGPGFLWLLDAASPVRRNVLSVCCANLLIFVLRTVLTFVILHSILESRENARARNLKRGLTREGIKRLQRVESSTSDAENVCSICLCNFTEGDAMLVLPCDERHGFHEECVMQWLLQKASCPLCNRSVPDTK